MADMESIYQDALDDERRIIEENEIKEFLEFPECLDLDPNAKINEQSPQVQKYWLGRLAYELAIRSEEVINIKAKIEASGLPDTPDMYAHETISKKERALILALHDYGFTSMPAKNVLKTEHTSYPTWPEANCCKKLNINTINNINKLLNVIDGKTRRVLNLNNDIYTNIKNIGQIYTQDKIWLTLIYY